MPNELRIPKGTDYTGRGSIYQYVNADGADPGTACGQAAVATLLVTVGARSRGIDTLRAVEKKYPADNLGGVFGTSSGRIREAMRGNSVSPVDVEGEADLKGKLKAHMPVICLIQNDTSFWGTFGSSHYFVLFAYNDAGVFVTNYGVLHLPWTTFRDRWTSTHSWAMGLKGKGISAHLIGDHVRPPRNLA